MNAITVWKDGTWKVWQATDAHYAENDPEWLVTIPSADKGSVGAKIAAVLWEEVPGCGRADCDRIAGLIMRRIDDDLSSQANPEAK
jgi:hypothetical protein